MMVSLSYHRREFAKLWHAFAKQSRAARADSGVPLPRQLWELFALRLGDGKLSAEDYYKLRVYRNELSPGDKRKYLSNQAMPDGLVGRWKVVADDKLLTYGILGGLGIRTPKVFAICHSLREYPDSPGLRTGTAAADFLRHQAPYPMIMKPIRGMYSKDVLLLESYAPDSDSIQLAGGDSLPAAAAGNRCFERTAGYLFQELLVPHAKIREAISDKICTLRVIVTLEQNSPRLMMAVWKIAAGENAADNYWRPGNFMAKLDQSNGRILHCVSGLGPEYRVVKQHPKTGKPLAGFQVPCYREAIDLALRAARAFPDIIMQAWDIAITDDGPIPLEINVVGSLFIPQLINQEGLWAGGFREFVESYR